MLDLIFISLVGLNTPIKAAGPAITLSSAGGAPAPGAAFRFFSEGQGEQPGDFLVRSQVEKALKAKGFQEMERQPRYLVEVAVSARPPNVGAYQGPATKPVWLDKPVAAGRAPFYTTARFAYTDALALYSTFQEPFVSWARRTGGSVIEAHAYAIAPEAMRPAPALRAAMWREVVQMLPELERARLLHEEFQQQDNFSRWAPGDHATRPGTETGVKNVMLAGDFVRLPAPAALMEAAVMSGRQAANAIFEREGLRQSPIPTVALKGPLT